MTWTADQNFDASSGYYLADGTYVPPIAPIVTTFSGQTALNIIKSALRKINSFQPGDQLAAPEANDCLEVLNDLLDSWSIDKATIFCVTETVVNFTALQYQYTIGPGGNFSTDNVTGLAIARPVRITGGFTRFSGLD